MIKVRKPYTNDEKMTAMKYISRNQVPTKKAHKDLVSRVLMESILICQKENNQEMETRLWEMHKNIWA